MRPGRVEPDRSRPSAHVDRSEAEGGNHAFKAVLGDQVYSRNDIAQRNEILCMCIAYNLTRLIYLSLDQGIEVDFTGAEALAGAEWVSLEVLHKSLTVERSKTRHLA